MKFVRATKPKVHKKVGYELRINTMIGDADGYEEMKVGIFCEDELHLLQEVIEVCDRMLAEYPNGRGGYDDYNHIPGFNRWFGDGEDEDNDESTESVYHLTNGEWWACDPSYCDIQNSIKGYEVVYLENGLEYAVSIIK